MIGAQISRWLNANGSFLEGMAYCQQVNPAAYQRLLAWTKAPIITPEAKEQLRDALRAHAASAPDPALSFPISYDPHSRGGSSSAAPLPEPPEVQALRKQGIQYHKQYAVLKERLRALFDDPTHYSNEDRYNISREIMEDVIPATDAVYDRIRQYEHTGTMPESGTQQVVRDTVEKYEKLLSLRPRISRIRGWMEKGERPMKAGLVKLTEKDLAELRAELDEKLAQVQLIETELGIDE